MTLTQIQYYTYVCEFNNVTKAADFYHVSQPAVSKAIQSLEEEFGVSLFRRTGRKLELTEAGRLFYSEAKRMVAEVEEAIEGTRKLTDENGELRLATMSTIGTYVVPEILQDFQLRHPELKVSVYET